MLLDDTDYPKDWPIIHLDRVAKRGSGHTPSKSHPEYWNGNIKWVSLADSYRLDGGYISDTDKKISQEGIKNSSAVIHPPETVILSRDAGVGKSAVTKEAMAVSQHFIAWNCNQAGKVAPWFLYYTLQFHQKELERQAVGSTIKTIGLPFFKNLEIALPPLPEQKKIAAILSTWDRAIEGTEKLLANSQQQKKALMQQLLTGKKRLPGFTGAWKVNRLGEISSSFTGLSGKTKNDFGSGHKYITYKNVFLNSYVNINDVEYVEIKTNENQNKLQYGDILFTTSSETPEEVGMSSVFLYGGDDIFYLNSFCFGFRPKNSLVMNPNFSQFLFRGEEIRRKIQLLAQGATRYNISKNKLSEISLNLPSLPEQKAIAAVLTTADEEITALESDLARLRQEKKALMQQLLTGKRRVTID